MSEWRVGPVSRGPDARDPQHSYGIERREHERPPRRATHHTPLYSLRQYYTITVAAKVPMGVTQPAWPTANPKAVVAFNNSEKFRIPYGLILPTHRSNILLT